MGESIINRFFRINFDLSKRVPARAIDLGCSQLFPVFRRNWMQLYSPDWISLQNPLLQTSPGETSIEPVNDLSIEKITGS